jgi:hypothetical protein
MNNDENLQNVDTFQDDKELKEVTIKGKLEKMKTEMMIAGACAATLAAMGVGSPFIMPLMGADPTASNMLGVGGIVLAADLANKIRKKFEVYQELKADYERGEEISSNTKGIGL